jgi:hypothetical protein
MTNLETREDVQAFWANVIYIFLPKSRKVLGVSHRKCFWMG